MEPVQPRRGHSPASHRFEAVQVPKPIDAYAASMVVAVCGKDVASQVEPRAEHAALQLPPGALATNVVGGGGAATIGGGGGGGTTRVPAHGHIRMRVPAWERQLLVVYQPRSGQ
jgi:hypothetical protein